MKDLISRVGDDVAHLRHDISSLFSHTGRHTIPSSARDLKEQTLDHLHSGSEYAAARLRYLRNHPGPALGLLGGLIVLGAVGAGIYYFCKSDEKCRAKSDSDYEDQPDDRTSSLPSYIT